MKILAPPITIGPFPRRDYILQLLAFLVPIIGVASIVLWFAYHLDVKMVEQNLAETEHHHMIMRETLFKTNISSAIADLRMLADIAGKHPSTEALKNESHDPLLNGAHVLCRYHPHYHQIRKLTPAGGEQLRIDCKSGDPKVVSEALLRSHVEEGLLAILPKAGSGGIAMSGIDIMSSGGDGNGKVKDSPVIHFALGLSKGMVGEPGILVLDVDLRHLISDLMLDTGEGGSMILAEASGRFVRNPTGTEGWGDTLRTERQMRFQNAYPAVWQALKHTSRGSIETDDGLFTFAALQTLEFHDVPSYSDGKSHIQLNESPEWHIVSYVPQHDMSAGRGAFAMKFLLLIPAPLIVAIYLTHLALRRKRAVKDLKDNEGYLTQIMDNMVDGIITTDPSGVIDRTNQAILSLFQIDPQNAVVERLSSIIPMQEVDPKGDLSRLWRGDPSAQKLARGQMDLLRHDGTRFPAEILLMEAELGGQGRFIWIIRDISERQAFQAKQDAERMRFFHQTKIAEIGLIAGGIIHEVGNPIAALNSVVSQLSEEAEESDAIWSEEARENLKMISHQVNRLSIITREISDFIRIRPGEEDLFDLNFLIRSTTRLVQYDARWKYIHLDLDLDPSIPAIMGIQDQISQVLMNLLVNAADAVQDRPDSERWVRVRTEKRKNFVLLSIIDNGHGMNEETKQQVFESFFTTKGDGKGTGLGLSLCKTIISAHNGGIEVNSNAGEGAEFLVSLPVPQAMDSING